MEILLKDVKVNKNVMIFYLLYFFTSFIIDPNDCTKTNCKNGGICVDRWELNKRVCDCESTSYTGKYCHLSKT